MAKLVRWLITPHNIIFVYTRSTKTVIKNVPPLKIEQLCETNIRYKFDRHFKKAYIFWNKIHTIGPARAFEGRRKRSPTSLRRSVSCSDVPGKGWTTNCRGFEPPIVKDAERFDDAILSAAKCCIHRYTFRFLWRIFCDAVIWRDFFLSFFVTFFKESFLPSFQGASATSASNFLKALKT